MISLFGLTNVFRRIECITGRKFGLKNVKRLFFRNIWNCELSWCSNRLGCLRENISAQFANVDSLSGTNWRLTRNLAVVVCCWFSIKFLLTPCWRTYKARECYDQHPTHHVSHHTAIIFSFKMRFQFSSSPLRAARECAPPPPISVKMHQSRATKNSLTTTKLIKKTLRGERTVADSVVG